MQASVTFIAAVDLLCILCVAKKAALFISRAAS